MSQEFSTLTTIRNESKQTQQILNLERFGLLPENVQNTVNEAREEGNFPSPMEPISKQEFDEFKKVLVFLFRQILFKQQKAVNSTMWILQKPLRLKKRQLPY